MNIDQFIASIKSDSGSLLPQDLVDRIKKFLHEAGYSDEQQERWLKFFYTHWMSNVISRSIDILADMPEEELQKANNEGKQDAVLDYIKKYLTTDPEKSKVFQAIVEEEFGKSLDHFMAVTSGKTSSSTPPAESSEAPSPRPAE